ncbi:MAG: hypothetical protein NXI16_09265 [Alphaproteobacteria bacterium]|nr:hypothetical protein [Alphaproteobacteria bacterium]
MAGPPCPDALDHVWTWFATLSAARGRAGDLPQPISFQDIAAWQQVTGIRPSPFERDLLLRADRLWLDRLTASVHERAGNLSRPSRVPARSR